MGLMVAQETEHLVKPDSVVTFYARKAKVTALIKAPTSVDVRFPKVFSFIENPEQTISTLEYLTRFARDERVDNIKIHHRRCETIDHCAEAVATVLVEEAHHKHRKNIWGRLPSNPQLREMVVSVGLPSVLGITEATPNFIVYPVRRGKRELSGFTTMAEEAAGDLVEYINKCLRTLGFRLAQSARSQYSDLVCETINNAEVHSRRSDWWVAAYYRTDEGQGWGHCHITIFCFGDSLAESLQRLEAHSLLRRRIEQRVAHHRKLGFSKTWQEDDLWTLFAIQRGVSRQNNEANESGHYGQGTADLIVAFHALAGNRVPPKMCLISGNTHILFDGRYRVARNSAGKERIAFNGANSLAYRPDLNYVRHLGRTFPGTLVSLRFVLDREHLDDFTS